MEHEHSHANGPLSLILTPSEARLTDDLKTVTVLISIENVGLAIQGFLIRVTGLDPDWYSLREEQVSIPPGQSLAVPLIIHPPESATEARDRMVFEVRVYQPPGSEPITIAKGAVKFVTQMLDLDLDPAEVRLEPAHSTVTLTATVFNNGAVRDQLDFRIDGLDPSWYTLPLTSATLSPGDVLSVPVEIHPPSARSGSNVSGRYSFLIIARSTTNPSVSVAAQGMVELVGIEKVVEFELIPNELRVELGATEVEAVITLRNKGTTIERYDLEVLGLEPAWYSLQPDPVSLFPGDSIQIPLKITLPKNSDIRAGLLPFTVQARAQSTSSTVAEAHGKLRVDSFVEFRVGLEPSRATWPDGKFNLRLSNRGNDEIRVMLSASNPGADLEFEFSSIEAGVQAGSSLLVPLVVKPKHSDAAKSDRSYQFTITASIATENNIPQEVQAQTVNGELVYIAPLPVISTPQPLVSATPPADVALAKARMPWLLGLGIIGALALFFVILSFPPEPVPIEQTGATALPTVSASAVATETSTAVAALEVQPTSTEWASTSTTTATTLPTSTATPTSTPSSTPQVNTSVPTTGVPINTRATGPTSDPLP